MPSRRLLAVLALAAAPATVLAALPGAPAGAAATRTVVLKDIDFTPSRISVSKGTVVTWRWRDGNVNHNVRSVGTRRFKSSALKSTGTHRVTFTKAGTYRYVCTVHPGMDGSVRVR